MFTIWWKFLPLKYSNILLHLMSFYASCHFRGASLRLHCWFSGPMSDVKQISDEHPLKMSFQVSTVPDYINVNSIFAGMVMKEKSNSIITTTVFGEYAGLELQPALKYQLGVLLPYYILFSNCEFYSISGIKIIPLVFLLVEQQPCS